MSKSPSDRAQTRLAALMLILGLLLSPVALGACNAQDAPEEAPSAGAGEDGSEAEPAGEGADEAAESADPTSPPRTRSAPVVITLASDAGDADEAVDSGEEGSDEPGPLQGQTAPDFTMTALDGGEPFRVSDMRGTTIMLNFWATWCVPCRVEMPYLEEAYQNLRSDDFELVAVDVLEQIPDDQIPGRVQKFVDGLGLTFPFVYGSAQISEGVQKDYELINLPVSIIVGPEGQVLHDHRGKFDSAAEIEALIAEVSGEG